MNTGDEYYEVTLVLKVSSSRPVRNKVIEEAVVDVISNDDVTTEMIFDHINEYQRSARIKHLQIIVGEVAHRYPATVKHLLR